MKPTPGRRQTTTYTLLGFGNGFDWRSTRFLEPMPPNRLCDYCGQVCSSMALLPCCHLVCGCCYGQCQHDHVCVLDGEAFKDHDVGWAIYTIHDLAKREILCWNAESGCDTVGPSLEVLDHFNSLCRCHPVSCPQCNQVVKNGDIVVHLASSCDPATLMENIVQQTNRPMRLGLKETRRHLKPQNLISPRPANEDSLESESLLHHQSGSFRLLHKASAFTSSPTGPILEGPRDTVSCSPILCPNASAAGLEVKLRTKPPGDVITDSPQQAGPLRNESQNVASYPEPSITHYTKPERRAQLSEYADTLEQINVACGSIEALMALSLQSVSGQDGANSSTMHDVGVCTPDISHDDVHRGQSNYQATAESVPSLYTADVGVGSTASTETASELEGESDATLKIDVFELAAPPCATTLIVDNPGAVVEETGIEDAVQKRGFSAIQPTTAAVDSEDMSLTQDNEPASPERPARNERHASNFDYSEARRTDCTDRTAGIPTGISQSPLSVLSAQQNAISHCLRIIVTGMDDVKEFLHKIITEDLPFVSAACKELRARMTAHAAAWGTLRQELKDEMRTLSVAIVQDSGTRTISNEDAKVIAPDRLAQKIDLLVNAAKFFLRELLTTSRPILWSVDNWSELKAKAVTEGDAMHHHYAPLHCIFYGYNIVPGIKIDSTVGLSRVQLSFCLRKGIYDDFLQWPMEKELVLSVLHPTDKGKVRTLVVDTRHGNVENYLKPDDEAKGPFFSPKSIKAEYFDAHEYVAADKLSFKFEVK